MKTNAIDGLPRVRRPFGVAAGILAGVILIWSYTEAPATLAVSASASAISDESSANAGQAQGETSEPSMSSNQSDGSPGTSDILKMVKANVDPQTIQAFINGSPIAYRLSAEDIITLQHQGVSGSILTAILEHGTLLRSKMRQAVQSQSGRAAEPAPRTSSQARPMYTYLLSRLSCLRAALFLLVECAELRLRLFVSRLRLPGLLVRRALLLRVALLLLLLLLALFGILQHLRVLSVLPFREAFRSSVRAFWLRLLRAALRFYLPRGLWQVRPPVKSGVSRLRVS